MRMPKGCFWNAHFLVKRYPKFYRYVEGVASMEGLHPEPTLHAWVIDDKDRAIDPTWANGVEYFGVVFDGAYVKRNEIKDYTNHGWNSLLEERDDLLLGKDTEKDWKPKRSNIHRAKHDITKEKKQNRCDLFLKVMKQADDLVRQYALNDMLNALNLIPNATDSIHTCFIAHHKHTISLNDLFHLLVNLHSQSNRNYDVSPYLSLEGTSCKSLQGICSRLNDLDLGEHCNRMYRKRFEFLKSEGVIK
jgi:hypothetical protein